MTSKIERIMPSRVPHGALNPPSSVYLAAHSVHRLGQLDITLPAADMHVGSCSHHNKPLDTYRAVLMVACKWYSRSWERGRAQCLPALFSFGVREGEGGSGTNNKDSILPTEALCVHRSPISDSEIPPKDHMLKA